MLAAVPLLAIALCAPAEPPLIDQVRQRRTIRQAGLAIGGTFLTAAATAGVVGGLIEPAPVLTVAVGAKVRAALVVSTPLLMALLLLQMSLTRDDAIFSSCYVSRRPAYLRRSGRRLCA